MRIIAGELKGRKIDAVSGDATRPTTDKVREAFASSIVSARTDGFVGASFLDAFAGSGAVGIEALSRGAAVCTFVESNLKAAATITSNLSDLPLKADVYKVVRADVFSLVSGQNVASRLWGVPFDIVYLDPPYATPIKDVCEFVAALASSGSLNKDAIVAYEMSCVKTKKRKGQKKSNEPSGEVQDIMRAYGAGFEFMSARQYGTTQIVYAKYVGIVEHT